MDQKVKNPISQATSSQAKESLKGSPVTPLNTNPTGDRGDRSNTSSPSIFGLGPSSLHYSRIQNPLHPPLPRRW